MTLEQLRASIAGFADESGWQQAWLNAVAYYQANPSAFDELIPELQQLGRRQRYVREAEERRDPNMPPWHMPMETAALFPELRRRGIVGDIRSHKRKRSAKYRRR